jgi:hypothetical protein
VIGGVFLVFMKTRMTSEPKNKLTLEWLHLPGGLRGLGFDERTWKAFEDTANTHGHSAEQMIINAVAGSLGPINSEPNPLTLEWLRLPGRLTALTFDEETWKIFKNTAKARGKSPEQIIITAVAGSLGSILVNNYALNRFTGGFSKSTTNRRD